MVQAINKPVDKILNAFRAFQGTTKEEKQNNQSLIDTLREMEKVYLDQVSQSVPSYDRTLPKTTGGIVKTFQEESQEELERKASDMVAETIDEKINKLNETTEKKLTDLSKKLNLGQESMANEMGKADAKLQQNSTKNLYSATNKGIAYSSIYENMQENAFGNYKAELTKVKNDYDSLNVEIEREISFLYASKENALQEYDLEKAVKLEKQLNKLKSDQQSAIASVNTYNKKILDAETKFQIERAKNIEKLENEWKNAKDEQYTKEKQSGYTGDNLTEMNERYSLAKSFYFGVTKQSAKKLLEENQSALKSALGEVYYKRLYEENNNR
jgi:hypothetical protein